HPRDLHSSPTRRSSDLSDGRTRRSNHLILGHDERDIVRPEFAIELAGRAERVVLPATAVVDRHFGIPLREIPFSPTSSLSPRQGDRKSTRLNSSHLGIS